MKKAKLGLSVLLLVGIVYAVLGSLFVGLGTCLWVWAAEQEAIMTGGIFVLIGSVFLVLGIVFLLVEWRKKKQIDQLIASGRYIWGEVVDLVPNFNVRINNTHPYIAVVRYVDPYGVSRVFKSGNLWIYRDPALIGHQVRVYTDKNYRHYYVDVERILPHYVEH